MHDNFDMIMTGRLLLATLFGALIGLEREIHGRTAGFRTHLLVSLGSALFVVVSLSFYRLYGNFDGVVPVGVDPGRVAAQVVTGIGFLGAGAIIQAKASVRGLTTAACLWVAAAIGLACGLGLFMISSVVTAIALVSLISLKKIEGMLSRDSYGVMHVESDDVEGQLSRVSEAITACGFEVVLASIGRHISGSLQFELQIKMNGRELSSSALQTVSNLEGIRSVTLRLKTI